MRVCNQCGAELRAEEWDCSRFANGAPTRDHRLLSVGIRTFEPYVDEHISVDGKPVLITSREQRQKLMRNQWEGDHQVKIEERHDAEADYRIKHRREYVASKKH